MSNSSKTIFLEALELNGDERARFLEEQCDGNLDLRERVDELLKASSQSDAIFGEPQEPLYQLKAGTAIGPYVLNEPIGEGGFAVVWRAEQQVPIRRTVALKVLKPGMDSREVIARFEAERQALALMDHRSIATVFDGGTTDSGHPWFAMELVHGLPITEYCSSKNLNKSERLALFLEVCRAVQHAHQKGIIHRDLKPSNVMIGEIDGRAAPTVIDFGIAKAIAPSSSQDSLLTREGQLIGTPAYMSPEQVNDGLDVDTRADVYSLGALLYELLSGSRPFEEQTLREAGIVEILRVIQEVSPPRPSTQLSATTSLRASEIRGDLDWVIMRCLEKERDRRYDSVAELGNDVERHLRGVPVSAGPPDLAYRARKFVARHRWAVGISALFVAFLFAAIISIVGQLQRARRAEKGLRAENERAELELVRSQAIGSTFEEVLMGIEPGFARTRDTELLEHILERADARVEEISSATPLVEATLRRVVGGAYRSIAKSDKAEEQLRAALQLRQSELAPDHADVLESMTELGGLLFESGQQAEATELLRDAAIGLTETLGNDHETTLVARQNYGAVLYQIGRLEEAQMELLIVEKHRIQALGELHEDTLRVQNTLAGVLSARGESEEALVRFERIARAQMEGRGLEQPETLKALNNWAQELVDVGRLADARPIFEQALEVKRNILAAGDPSILVSESNYAQLLKKLGETELALQVFADGLAAATTAGAVTTPTMIMARINYGNMLHNAEREQQALEAFTIAASDARSIMAADTPLSTTADSTLAWQHSRMDAHAAALPLHESVLVRAKGLYPERALELGVYNIRLGTTLAHLSQAKRARNTLEAGLDIVRGHGSATWIERAESELKRLPVGD